MRLQRLEIKGFKSFADHTIINFDEDITGVVGPNGSGKSNLVDAIKWVLGEQKMRDLRTEKMENVIFNGTKKRGKSGRAFVGLSFVNNQNRLPSEYHEIVISRTLYRSGESEYRLNNTKCRLKDIKNLFLDTGVGSDSYAIISLGMVDEILLDRENFRRKMIEQAAGIEKYRLRKRKTILKLDRTQDDLNRLLDLLHEVETNMKSLRLQATRARKYKEIKVEYKQLALQFTQFHLNRIKTGTKTLDQQYEKVSSELLKSRTGLAQLEQTIEKKKFELLEEEKGMGKNKNQLNELMSQIRKNETDKGILTERRKFLQQQKQRSELQLSDGEAALKHLVVKIEGSNAQLNVEKSALEQVYSEFQKLQKEKQKLEDQLSQLKDTLSKITEGELEESELLKATQVKSALVEERLQSIARSLNQNILRKKEETERLQQISSELGAQEQNKKELSHRIEETETRKAEIKKKYEELNIEIEECRKKINLKNRKISGLESELNIMTNMVENMEGYPEAVKTLSKNKALKKDFELFSDIINIDDQYKNGLELFLSSYINSLVSKNMESAFAAVKFLRDSQGGKVDIIFKGSENGKRKAAPIKGAIAVLDVLDYKEKHRQIIENIFSNVYVVDELPASLKVEEGITLIEASGERILSAGRLRGGSKGLFEGKKLGRKKNIALLEKNLVRLNDEVDQLNLDLNQLTEKRQSFNEKDLNEEHQILLRKRQELFSTLAVNQEKLQQINKKLQQIEIEDENFEKEKERLFDQQKELLQKIEWLGHQESKRDDKVGAMEKQLEQYSSERNNKSEVVNKKNIEFLRQENLVKEIEKNVQRQTEEKVLLEKKIEEAKEFLNSSTGEVDKISKELQKIDANLQASYDKKKQIGDSLNQEERNYYQKKEAINELEKDVRKINAQSQHLREELNVMEGKKQELSFEKKDYLNRLEIEFGQQVFEELDQQEDLEPSVVSEYQTKMDRHRVRLRNYGEINPLAIESYEEVKTRYEELNGQHNDIVEAKESLQETIQEIEVEATNRFSKTFELVRVNFQKVFRSLFTEEDECDLFLEDEEDVLNTHIKIIAKPKGKKPQSINQLSGGEKALTSTAFLFALYLLKPAPFCVFDEIDAPLDDQNVLKFNKIIKEFSSDSQFIIITHNKLSMSNVDVIYGVTMGEEGVSQISGVDFRKLKNPAISA